MNRPSKDLRDLAGLYALDALDPDDTARFEAFLATSPETQAEVAEFREAAATLAAAESVTSSDALRDAVLGEVAVTRQEAPVVVSLRRPRWAFSLAAAAALLLVVAVGVVLVGRSGDSDELATVLESSDAVTVALDSELTPNLRVVWSADLDRLVVVPGGSPTLVDDVYVLWSLPASGPPERVVAFDASGSVLVEEAGRFAATERLAVTIESDPDVTAPSEPIVVRSDIVEV